MLAEQAHDTCEVLAIVIGGQDLLLLSIQPSSSAISPEELPEAHGPLPGGPGASRQLAKLLVTELHVGHCVSDYLGVAGLVTCVTSRAWAHG